MTAKTNIVKVLISFTIIALIILGYLTIKYFYYQNQVFVEIKTYNNAVKEYNRIYESMKLDSNCKNNKLNFYYINDSDAFINEINLGYKELSELIEDMKIKVVFAITNLKLLKKDITKPSGTMSFDDSELFINKTKADKKLFYSTDEIQEIYEESYKKQNEIINKVKPKK